MSDPYACVVCDASLMRPMTGRAICTQCHEAEARDTKILAELRGHLKRATEWANEHDQAPPGQWSCVTSTLAAVDEGRVGLALERWNDLSSRDKPELSPEAENWKAEDACPTFAPHLSCAGPHGKCCQCPYPVQP